MSAYHDQQVERCLKKAEAILDRALGASNEHRTALAAEATAWVYMAEVHALMVTGERR